MQFAELLVFRVANVAACLELALAARQDDGDALDGMVVAVAHAGSEEHHGMIKKRAIVVAVGFQLSQEVVELLHVPEADFQEGLQVGPAEIAEEMGEVVVLLGDAQEIEDHAAVAVPKHIGDGSRRIRPQGQGDEIDHRFDLLVEIGTALWSFQLREIDARGVAGLVHILNARFGFPNGSQILIQRMSILISSFAGEGFGVFIDAVEKAGHGLALLGIAHRVPEQAVENELRVAFSRYGGSTLSIGNVAATELPSEETFGSQFE